jgi:hypothetical protein
MHRAHIMSCWYTVLSRYILLWSITLGISVLRRVVQFPQPGPLAAVLTGPVWFRLFTNSMIWRCGLTWFDGVCGFTPVSFAGFNIWRKLHRHRPSLLSVFHSWCPSWCSPAMLQWHPLAHHFPALAPCSQSMPAFHGRVIMDGNGRRAEHQRGWCASRLSVSQLPWATRGRLLNEQQQQTKQTACSCFCSLLIFSRDFTSFLLSKLCNPY